ncbi:RluA family pseudouridine synthase, partial [bacterium]|nr:RluA family pseudouridine synthase [bacterium]
SHAVTSGDVVEVQFEAQEPYDVKPEAIPLEVLYDDEWLLVVNKPAGMVTHPAHGNFSGTLVNALLHRWGAEHAGDSIRPGIVHRLDKGTSGLLVVAKDEVTHRKLTEQFSSRTVEREYRSIVWGRFRENEGVIDTLLDRHPGDRKRYAVVRRGGKQAITTYRIEETFADTSYLALKLGTGRTHQIRVHLEHIGHPVFGDSSYGGRLRRVSNFGGMRKKFYTDALEQVEYFLLHARTLGFVHPASGETMRFAVEPPAGFDKVLKTLREDALRELDI